LYKKYNKHHISIGFDTQINDSKLGDYVWIGDKCRVSKSCIGRHTYMGGGSSVISLVTTALFVIIAPSPIFTPNIMVAFVPINTSLPM